MALHYNAEVLMQEAMKGGLHLSWVQPPLWYRHSITVHYTEHYSAH